MPWPGLRNFLMGCPRPLPEDPYVKYLRSNNLENRERHRRGIQPAPLMEHNEWTQNNGQAIAAWHGQIVERHNRDLGTSYLNWDDFERAMDDSTRRDQNVRENMRRGRLRKTEHHPFFGGLGQPRNRFEETDEEWYARMMDTGGGRRKMDDGLRRDFVGRGPQDLGRRQGGTLGARNGSSSARRGSTTGWAGQSGSQNGGQNVDSSGGDAAGNMSSDDAARQDEAEAFLSSARGGGRSGAAGRDWQDEAGEFLHPRQ